MREINPHFCLATSLTVSLAAICTVLRGGGAPEKRAGHCSESVCARNFLKCPEITPDDKTRQQKTKFLMRKKINETERKKKLLGYSLKKQM